MKIDKVNNTVTFDITEEEIKKLELSLDITKIDPDDFFNRHFLRHIKHEALRDTSSDNRPFNDRHPFNRSQMDPDRLLRRWSTHRDLVNHNIFKAYFIVLDKFDKVSLENLQSEFIKQYAPYDIENRAERKFLSSFRLLCSDSEHTYGKFFEYEKVNKFIQLNPERKELIEKYKKEFLELN